MARKNVSFHPVLTENTREQLDRLARLQGVSRSEVIKRALNLLDLACTAVPSARTCQIQGHAMVTWIEGTGTYRRCARCGVMS